MTNMNCVTSRHRSMSSHLMLVVAVLLLTSCLSSNLIEARALRPKRSGYSDQRLAELETLVALSNMRGRVVTVPVAYGIIDPARIGKRSYDRSEDSGEGGVLLERLMRRFRSQLSGGRTEREVDEDVAQMIAEA